MTVATPAASQTTTAPSGGTDAPAWHTLSVEDALRQQGVEPGRGLSAAEVAVRTQRYGPNKFAEAPREPRWRAFLRQYRDPMQLVLLVAGLITLVIVRELSTALLLFGLTVFNALIGLSQEGKAEASVAALQKMMIIQAKVRRDGAIQEVPAEQLVPGDIVAVEAGDRIPADGRIISAATLEIDESALTGESVPVPKQVDAVPGIDTPLGDRVDMAYMNTSATRGSGEILISATGMATEVGHISGLLQTTGLEKTPLTKQLDRLTSQIIVIAGLALVASMALGYWRGTAIDELFIGAVAFAVAAIPTGLPAVVTTLLAMGTQTLAAAGAIVKRLRSVETLGSTSAINSDKTGTLTLNQMTAVQMAIVGRRYSISGEGYSTTGQITHTGGQPDVPLEPYLLPMALCADAVVNANGEMIGDPTEGALVVLAAKGGVDPALTREQYPRVATLPFDAAYKFMSTFHRMKDDAGREVVRAYVKGAPDQLLGRAATAHGPDGTEVPIDQIRQGYLDENERLGKQGLRVMATGQRDFDPAAFDPNADLLPLVADLTLLALVGIVDPPRPQAKASIAQAHSAGIQVRMITGDHAVTAAAIAADLGITGRAITGADFAGLSDDEADRQIDDIGVIARVTPEHKVRLVEVLKRKGHIVAMTGDGVNDAPALKKADIGVAMGITGTEVSKEAAVMILTDDNFATIVKAVELGRALYDNLLKYIRFQMGVLFGFIWTFLGSGLFNVLGGVPFFPQQTLWINFTVDIFQSVGLGMGAQSEGLMDRKPRPANAQVMPGRLAIRLAIIGLVMAVGTLSVIQWATITYGDDTLARTMGMVTFSFFNLFYGLAANDELGSMFSHSTLGNGKLMQMTGLSLLTIVLGVHLDVLQRFLLTTDLNLEQWLICVAVGAVSIVVTELAKVTRRRSAARHAVAGTAPAEAAAT